MSFQDPPTLRWVRRALIAISLVAGVVNIVSASLVLPTPRTVSMWFVMGPLIVAGVLYGLPRRASGRWMLVGMAFGFAGDVLGGYGFLVLLGLFLIGHLCYVVAFWPFRAASLIGRPGMAVYLAILVVGLMILLPAMGRLAGPVILYALVLSIAALFATAAGWVGIIGGALFMFSDLILAVTRFAVQWPTAIGASLVMGTYVPAQILMLLSYVVLARRERSDEVSSDGSPRQGRHPRPAAP